MYGRNEIRELEKLRAQLGRMRTQYLDYERKSDTETRAYWTGKKCGVGAVIELVDDLLYKWTTANEDELEAMADERSEKDCMWEDRA